MIPLPIIGLGLGFASFLAIMLLFIGLNRGRDSAIVERINQHAGADVRSLRDQLHPAPTDDEDEGLVRLLRRLFNSAPAAAVNRTIETRGFGAKLSRGLAKADVRLKPSEYLAIWVGMTVGLPLTAFVLGSVVEAFNYPASWLIAFALGWYLPRLWLRRRQSGRVNAFNKQLPDVLTTIANALRSGSSQLQAFEGIARSGAAPASIEFGRVIREINLGLPLASALDNLVRRVDSEDLSLMATAISIQAQVGGNLAEILDSISTTIRERGRIRGEIRTLTAMQRMSGYVVAFLPIGIIGVLFLIAPTFMEPMFRKPPAIAGLPAGVVILSIGGFMMGVGFMIIRKIVDIKI